MLMSQSYQLTGEVKNRIGIFLLRLYRKFAVVGENRQIQFLGRSRRESGIHGVIPLHGGSRAAAFLTGSLHTWQSLEKPVTLIANGNVKVKSAADGISLKMPGISSAILRIEK